MSAILESIVTSNLKEVPCVFCSHVSGQLFSVTELKKHLKQFHLALKLYGCHCCGWGFASRDALAKHRCSSSFFSFLANSMITNIQEANFQLEFSSLVCSKCGLQIDLQLFGAHVDDQQMENLARQFQDCLLIHSPQNFILCTVYMFEETDIKNSFLQLSFVAEKADTFSCPIGNEALAIYIQEAFREQHDLQKDCRSNERSDAVQKVSIRNKKLDHNKYFEKCTLPDGDTQYLCKLCGFRTEVNTPTTFLIEHMGNKHLEMLGNLRLFNAQSQFERIDLGEGNFKYECKICGHLTKMNIKPSALSQHFKDRHPEIRAQAALSFASKKLGISENSTQVSVNNHIINGMSQRTEISLVLDEGMNDLSDHSETLLRNKWTRYKASLAIHFSSKAIISNISGLGLLTDDVYSCQLCQSLLIVGLTSAKIHLNSIHTSHYSKTSLFDASNSEQMLPVFCFYDMPYQGITCFICKNSLHCSLLSLSSHLARAHNKQFSYNLDSRDDVFITASKARNILCKSKTLTESGLMQSNSNYLLGNAVQMFDVKQEDILDHSPAQNTEPSSQSYPVVKITEVLGSAEFTQNFLAHTNDYDNLLKASTSTSTLNNSVRQNETTLASAIKSRRLEMLRNKKYKSCRFNAQEYFQIIPSDDQLSRRFKCIVCGHITKPNISPNTLSQHFSDKHPEMRANATMANTLLRTRSKRMSSRIRKRSVVPVITRLKESPTSQCSHRSALSTPLADDIVFGSFLNNNTIEEFERLAKSNTVFSYFEIVIKSDENMPIKLLNALSNLISKTLDSEEKRNQIANFAGELLRRSRSNSIYPIKSMSKLFICNNTSKIYTEMVNVEGIFTILDALLLKCGY